MRHMHVWALALFTPLLGLALAVNLGCGGKPTESTPEAKDGGKKEKDGGKSAKGAMTAVEGDYSGTIKGKVTFKGKKPNIDTLNKDLLASINKLEKKEDKDVCLTNAPEAQRTEQQWKIGPGDGVANVVVWIQPAEKGQYFKIDKSKKTWEDQVVMDQPHCAFLPHVVTMFTQYYDPDKKK